jgi:lysozyme
MTYREIAKAQLKVDEGVRAKVYKDSVGKLTIGVGHNCEDKPLSDRAIDVILEDDIADAEADARRLVPNFDALTDNRKAVLVNMSFNLGYARLKGFVNTLRAVSDGRYSDAADGMLASLWAGQVGDRAKRLADHMRNG